MEEPFELKQGDPIAVVARAINTIGEGELSDPNAVGVSMQQTPATPSSAPELISQAETSVTVLMPEITGIDTGGSSITSYNLVYGTTLSFTSIVGENPYNLIRQVTKGGLNTNLLYRFKYRVRNKFGWSAGYSPYIEVRTATKPSKITSVSF